MLKSRILTALILFFTLGYFLFFANELSWQGFLLLGILIAGWEWAGLAKVYRCTFKYIFAALVGILSWLGLQFLSMNILTLMTILMSLLVMVSVVQYQTSQGQVTFLNQPWKVLGVGIFMLVLFLTTLTHFRAQIGAPILFLTLMSLWAIDTGAYFAGKRFGQRKLAMYVSPGKTWEGVIGGGLFSFFVSLVGLLWLSPTIKLPLIIMALLMTLISLLSVFGDLFESLLKREAKLKDSGAIFPGHGGMLDRIDSLLIAMPIFYILWRSVTL